MFCFHTSLMRRIGSLGWLSKIAARLEPLRSHPEGDVAPRSQILETDDRGELDKLRLVKVAAQSAHQQVVDGWRRLGQRLGKFHCQTLKRLENVAAPPLRNCLDLFARDAVGRS